MDDVTVITLATEPKCYLPQFLDSCQRFGVCPVLLGVGQRWTDHMMKLHLLARWLQLHDLPADWPILWVDGYDCVFQLPPAAALAAYRAHGKPLLLSSEQGPGWPVPARLFPPSPTPYRGICAGVWMGTVAAVRALIAETEALDHVGLPPGQDQGLVQAYALAHRDQVAIDVNCLLAQTLSLDHDNFLVQHLGSLLWRNARTGTIPCVLHGAAGFDMTEVLGKLGYEPGEAPPQGAEVGGGGVRVTPCG